MKRRRILFPWPHRLASATHGICFAFAIAMLLSPGRAVFAQANPELLRAEDTRLLPYIQPGLLADIGGRRINLHCLGSGGPTVILMSGISSWSPVWYMTHSEIAKRALVCTFDRASYGFSDPAPRPQNVSDTVGDLHEALNVAELPPPFVLVAHSLGGLEARWFAREWPRQVAAMVLLDSSLAGDMLILVDQPGHDEAYGEDRYVPERLRCALMKARGPLNPSNPNDQVCPLLPLPDDAPAALRSVWPNFFTADHAATQVSLLFSLFTHHYDSADQLDFGDKPLIVLSADVGRGWSGSIGAFWRSYRPLWFAQHEALARLSTRGAHRVIDQSGHEIQLDKPQVVIDAVNEVLQQLQAGMKD